MICALVSVGNSGSPAESRRRPERACNARNSGYDNMIISGDSRLSDAVPAAEPTELNCRWDNELFDQCIGVSGPPNTSHADMYSDASGARLYSNGRSRTRMANNTSVTTTVSAPRKNPTGRL